MSTKKSGFIMKRILITLVIIFTILVGLFLLGRYGWKLRGFNACQRAGIENVTVENGQVTIAGFYPGSFPEGFLGYYAEESDGKLYIGFKFSALFGIFETGNFTINIPTKEDVDEVIMKMGANEFPIWNDKIGFLTQENQLGIFVKLETNDIYSIGITYEGSSGGMSNADGTAIESGKFVYMDNDIVYAVKDAEKPVPFTLTVKNEDGSVFASGDFVFEVNVEKMYLTVTSDGRIIEEQ